MRLHHLICLLGLGLGAMAPVHAQEYFNCEYSPRCEAIKNKQCAPDRNLKDKLSLVRLHNSADEVERTWLVLAGLEAEYCERLGARGNIVRDFASFRSKVYPKLHGAACATPQDCAEAYVKTTRERWERDDLDAKIKADLERGSQAGQSAMRIGGPVQPAAPAPAESIAADSWRTTTEPARPTRTTRSGSTSSN